MPVVSARVAVNCPCTQLQARGPVTVGVISPPVNETFVMSPANSSNVSVVVIAVPAIVSIGVIF